MTAGDAEVALTLLDTVEQNARCLSDIMASRMDLARCQFRAPRRGPRVVLVRLFTLVLILGFGSLPALADLAEQQYDLAVKHYKKAIAHYEGKNYQAALTEFKEAYRIRQLPRILLNIGQVYRKLGMASNALRFYEHYLRVEPHPKPEIKAEVERYIAQTRAMLDPPEFTIPLKDKRTPQEVAAADVAAAPATVVPATVSEVNTDDSSENGVLSKTLQAAPMPPPAQKVDIETHTGIAPTGNQQESVISAKKHFYMPNWFWILLGISLTGVGFLGVTLLRYRASRRSPVSTVSLLPVATPSTAVPQGPLLLALEFVRAERSSDPYGFRFVPQDYLLRSEGGAFKSGRLAWDTNLLADLEAVRHPKRDPAVVQRIGETLRRFLSSTRWTIDEEHLIQAIRGQRRVILSIRSAAAELYALPWELLTIEATGQHVGELPSVLVRYEWPDTHSIPRVEVHASSNRILVAWSDAVGPVHATEHITAIQAACSTELFDVDRDVLGNASYGRLFRALTAASHEGRPVAILHLLCRSQQTGSVLGLALDGDDAESGAVAVDAGRLRQLLAPHVGTLRLVVLTVCDSGGEQPLGNQLGSIAQALHRAGVGAVLASRYPLSIKGSIRLVATFYTELIARSQSLESAVLLTRQKLSENATQLDWASLQLYARAEDGTDTRPLARRG